ncbi:hypothetical protein [Desulfatiglans anilini]|nr:hypothetical protein [Desulfatiglans anilini]
MRESKHARFVIGCLRKQKNGHWEWKIAVRFGIDPQRRPSS